MIFDASIDEVIDADDPMRLDNPIDDRRSSAFSYTLCATGSSVGRYVERSRPGRDRSRANAEEQIK
jgi:hypothetical protein